jgi:hypothetical protein
MPARLSKPGKIFVSFAIAMVSTSAWADEEHANESANAEAVYDHGKSAYDGSDFATAAFDFARADELSPNTSVLELAIASAARADDPIFGMALVERADRRNLVESARIGRQAFEDKVGRIEVTCPASARCDATLDGAPLAVGVPVWVRVGEHAVALDADGTGERFSVAIASLQITSVRPTRLLRVQLPNARADDPAARRTEGRQLSPAWFGVALGATLIAGGFATASGLDASGTHDEFLRDRTNASLAEDGRSAETRTHILFGTTAGLAIGTTVLGLFFTKWREPRRGHLANAF